MAKISDLTAKTAIADTDIMHLRTSGGVDNKITGANLRQTLVTEVLTLGTTQSVSLSTRTTDVTVIGTQTAAITLTFNDVLQTGRKLKILNPTDHLLTAIVGGQSIVVSRDGELNFTSNGSAMVIGRPNSTVITTDPAYTISKGTRGRIFVCQPTAAMNFTITAGSGVDEREYITIINDSAYLITVKDATKSYYLEPGDRVNFFIDYNGNLNRSAGWGLQWINEGSTSASIAVTSFLDGGVLDNNLYKCYAIGGAFYYSADVYYRSSSYTNRSADVAGGTSLGRFYITSTLAGNELIGSYDIVRVDRWYEG